MLKIENLTKKYGDKVAVDNLSLEISGGEICAFIGHNGAGKTTTLKACIGILSFDSGDIYIDGKSVREYPLETKAVTAYIPDNPDMYEFLSGIKYLNFIADVFGVSESERNTRIPALAERLGITDALADSIGSYSHGMKQKLAIIAAFLHKPRIILMDEPFVGLDPRASFTLKEMMREHCEAGGSIFFSTHVLDVAERLCDRVAIIKGGKLVVSGKMDEVRGDASLEEVFLELEDNNA
ncbi:MAG: ABC transporter ATP-binding protein [Clostridia bacterium]|nr:ABC transporter ATP-binding protein [Clostridia bacterium]